MSKRSSPGFHTPFRDIKPPAKPAAPQPRPPAAAQAPPPPAPGRADDDRVFAEAMRGVKPLAAADRARRASPIAGAAPAPPPRAKGPAKPARDDDADAEAELADMVSGRAGVDRRLVRRLHKGDYPIDAELDLHGQTRAEAERAVDDFIARSLSLGRRCLLLIHGRGLNSGDAGPVLREAVAHHLSSGRAAAAVLAFTLAPHAHGGDGATLVLLRKKK